MHRGKSLILHQNMLVVIKGEKNLRVSLTIDGWSYILDVHLHETHEAGDVSTNRRFSCFMQYHHINNFINISYIFIIMFLSKKVHAN